MTEAASRPSLRRRVRWLFAVAALLVVIVGLFGLYALQGVLDARESLADELQPSQVDAQRALAAMVDQETGVRGFVLTGDDTFLQPYEAGRAAQEHALDGVERRVGDRHRIEVALRSVEDAMARWRTEYAQPTIQGAADGDPSVRTDAALDEGRVRFDAVRATLDDLSDVLAAAQRQARSDLDEATVMLGVALGVFAAVTLLGGLAIWRTYDRSVEVPLRTLTDAADQIAVGELRQAIPVVGPVEIAQLGETMELMRTALVDEIDKLERARAALEQRGAELERSNQDLEQFAYVASHDLQEPLRKVTSFCQLLQQRYSGQLDDRADQYIAFAVDGAKRMQVLINDLLEFSRAGRTSGALEAVPVGDAVDRSLEDLSLTIEEAGATVAVGPLPVVWAEPQLLQVVFTNLIGNAVKFHRPDAPATVEIAAIRADGGWRVTVADDGIGIAPEHVERVFEIFKRLHSRDAYDGTGIGLALCRKIVESFGGRIWAEPHDGSGARIHIQLRNPRPAQEAPT